MVFVENESGKDLSDIKIKLFYANGTRLLSDKSSIRNSSRTAPWSENFQTQIRVAEGQQPTENQMNIFYSSREYHIEYLNRFEVAEFSILSVRDIDEEVPYIYVESNKQGLVLRQKLPVVTQTEVFKAPVAQAVKYGLFLVILALVGLNLFVDNKWITGPILAFIGIFGSILGAFVFRFISFLKKVMN